MKNFFRKKLKLWAESQRLHESKPIASGKNGWTNPCKPNKNTLPPPVGIPSSNKSCCQCNKKN